MPATHTTPESHELQELVRRMADAGAEVVAMEVSSHALSQERAAGCVFSGAAFTNLTRDHLDYHGSLDAYFDAKAKLFRELLPRGVPAVLNLDDARVAALAGELPFALGFTVRAAAGAALFAERVRSDLRGVRFRLRTAAPLDVALAEVESPLIGAHNVDRKSTRLNSSHLVISYAVFCLKKKKIDAADTHFSKEAKNHVEHQD